MLAKVLHKQIISFIESRKVLSPLQFGFRRMVYAQDAIVFFLELVQNGTDKSYIVHAVLLGLSKIF